MPSDHLLQIIVHDANEDGVEVRYNADPPLRGTLDPQGFRLDALRTILKKEDTEKRIAGSFLFEALFQETVLDILIDCLETLVAEGKKLTIEIHINDSGLEDLPWSYLYFPKQRGKFQSDTFLKDHNDIIYIPPGKETEAKIEDDDNVAKSVPPTPELRASPRRPNPASLKDNAKSTSSSIEREIRENTAAVRISGVTESKNGEETKPLPLVSEREPKFEFAESLRVTEAGSSLRSNPNSELYLRSSYRTRIEDNRAEPPEKPQSIGQNICYLCFAEKDRDLVAELEIHLQVLVNENLIEIKKRDTIQPGKIIKDEVAHFLNTAKVTILFVTANFLVSADCLAITSLLKAEEKRRPEVFWVNAGTSMVGLTIIAEYQCANDRNKPLDKFNKKYRGEEMVKIGNELVKIIRAQSDDN
ncbi:MAG TPA: hypothetical protein VFZ34_28565 [Blastocatellia bacterium]|nr:hypothetical protein [Blastocatellia bacterium]